MAQQLFDRDTLRTDTDGYAVVQLVDNSLARVRPNSMLIIRGEVNNRGGVNSRINVESGTMNLNVTGRLSEYEIATPSATATIKGTEVRTVVNDDGSSLFTCFSGEVVVMAVNSRQEVTLTRRRQARVDATGNEIELMTVSNREMRQLEQDEDRMESAATPKKIRIRLLNDDGQVREVEIQYYEKEGQN